MKPPATHKGEARPKRGRRRPRVQPSLCKRVWEGLLYQDLVADPDGGSYHRWLFPPAAMLVQLFAGQFYGYSVYLHPLTHLCPPSAKADGSCRDWRTMHIATVPIMMLLIAGIAPTLAGPQKYERLGPRWPALLGACLWLAGSILGAGAVRLHNLPLLFIGHSILGGMGLGLTYISPISALFRWFADGRGLAMSIVVLGLWGGCLFGAALSAQLLRVMGLPSLFLMMGWVGALVMVIGSLSYRVPPVGWEPERLCGGGDSGRRRRRQREEERIPRTYRCQRPERPLEAKHFWLLWIMLLTHACSGFGVLQLVSRMNMSQGRYELVTSLQRTCLAIMGGGIFWSLLSDKIGRYTTSAVVFVCGMVACTAMPIISGRIEIPHCAGLCALLLLSINSGGVAVTTVFCVDMVGVAHFSATYSRLLTAVAAAALVGPYLLHDVIEATIAAGRGMGSAGNSMLFVICGILAIGLTASILMTPVERAYTGRKGSGGEEKLDDGPEDQDDEEEEEEVKEPRDAETGIKGWEDGCDYAASDGDSVSLASSIKGDKQEGLGVFTLTRLIAWWVPPLTAYAWGAYVAVKGDY